MKRYTDAESLFEAQLERIKEVTGAKTQVELARFLGIRQASVAGAKRRGTIPIGWLLTLMRLRQVNPEWVLSGKEPCFVEYLPAPGQSPPKG